MGLASPVWLRHRRFGGGIFPGASLAYDFAARSSLSPVAGNTPLTFTRASNATMYRSDGLLVYAPNNQWLYSQDFSNAAWSKNDVSITPNTAIAPDGTLTASAIVEGSTAATQHRISENITFTAGAQVIMSCYVKPAVGTRQVALISVGHGIRCYFNLQTLAIGNTTGVGAISGPDANGYYRVSAVGTSAGGSVTSYICLSNGITTGSETYNGDGTSSVYIWGAQFELGPYLTAYNLTTSSAYYGPRFDYNPTTLAARGLLVEEARTNILTFSNDFTDVIWQKTDTTITANNAISPEGIQNAALITEGSAGTAIVQQSEVATFAAGSSISASMYIKRGNSDWMRLRVFSADGSTNGANCWFNIGTGTAGTIGLVGTASGFTSSIQTLPNGWFRISASGIIDATSTSMNLSTISASAGGGGRLNNATRYQYGAQVEAVPAASANLGSSSYIPTFAATATRAADALTATPLFYNTAADTVFIQYISQGQSSNALARAGAWRFDDGSVNNTALLLTDIAGNANYNNVTAGVAVNISTGAFPTALTVHKAIVGAQNNDYAFYLDGAQVGVNVANTRPTGINAFYLGSRNGDYLNGWVQSFAYYPTRMTNALLQQRTQ